MGNSSGAYNDGGWPAHFANSKDRSVSRGRNDSDGNEDGGKKHPSGIPRPYDGHAHVSSTVATKGVNEIDFTPNNEGLPAGWSGGAHPSGGNWDSGYRRGSGGNWDSSGISNCEWSKGSNNYGPGVDSTRGWGGTKNVDGSGNDEIWSASGNSEGGCWHRGGRDHGPQRGGGCSSCWNGSTNEYQNSGKFGSNEKVWHATGNVGGHGCGRGGSHSWGGTKENEGSGTFSGNEVVWNAAGNSLGGQGNSGVGDHGPGGGYGGRAGRGDGSRGGHRGSARNGCCFGLGRGRSTERGDNNRSKSDFGQNSSDWGCNKDRKWSHDGKINFPGGSTYGSWGHNNVTNYGDNNGTCGKSSGSSCTSDAGACAGGSSWKHSGGLGNGDSGGWNSVNNNREGILESRPDSWGGHLTGNRGDRSSSGSQELVNTGRRDGFGRRWNLGGSGNGGW
ncbi:hypothetical protein DITRI_Ditri02bG0116000 [Diplodiscus trichospermus]